MLEDRKFIDPVTGEAPAWTMTSRVPDRGMGRSSLRAADALALDGRRGQAGRLDGYRGGLHRRAHAEDCLYPAACRGCREARRAYA